VISALVLIYFDIFVLVTFASRTYNNVMCYLLRCSFLFTVKQSMVAPFFPIPV